MSRSLLIVPLVILSACTAARREATGRILRNVDFIGNGGIGSGNGDYVLAQQMQQEESPPGVATFPIHYLVVPEVLKDELLPRDAYRLEMWYAHHGWFDARFMGWELKEVRKAREHRAAVVDATGLVNPGIPSMLDEIEIAGLNKGLENLGRAALRLTALDSGSQFNLENIDSTENALLDQLWNNAHPYGTVQTTITARPAAHQVDVRFDVDPGVTATFGEIRIHGNEKVKTRFIEDTLTFETGEKYKAETLQDTRQELFGFGTFSVVNVKPDLSDPTRTEVPIDVTLQESKFRTFRLGVGVLSELSNLTPRATMSFTHTNVLRQLVRFDLDANVGVTAAYDQTIAEGDFVPLYNVQGVLSDPWLFGKDFGMNLTGILRQDEQAGLWVYQNPEATLNFSWTPSREVIVQFGPHFEVYRYLLDSPEVQQFAQGVFGRSFENPYSLTTLDQSITIDQRDDPIRTRRGQYGALTLREAIPLREDGYEFLAATLEGRAYRPIGAIAGEIPIVGAMRLRGQGLMPLEGRALPYPELVFLGGANSLRGFRTNQVGPYDTLTTTLDRDGTENDTDVAYYLPHGGQVGVDGSAELRFEMRGGISAVTFADAGWLAETLGRPDLQAFRWDAGVGGRYDSPVGPIRFDLAFRPLYPEDAGPAEVLGSPNSESTQRYYDLFSLLGDYHPARDVPFAMLFFLAIGEAF